MSPQTPSLPHYIYSGSAMGVAAHFHRLDEFENLNHVIPTLGAAVLAPTGGLSQSYKKPYSYAVNEPVKRTLLEVRKIETEVSGWLADQAHTTAVRTDIEGLTVVESLEIESIHLHFVSSRATKPGSDPSVTKVHTSIKGMRLGGVEAEVEFDEAALRHCGTHEQLNTFFGKKDDAYCEKHLWRYRTSPDLQSTADKCRSYNFSLVENIVLRGQQDPERPVKIEGHNTIYWKGFGRIILGEVNVKGSDRRVTMVRLAMGSGAGGSGTAGSGQSNGQTG